MSMAEPDATDAGPYAAAAHLYRDAGWRGVLPLPANGKWPPPTGWTGNDGPWPSAADILAWTESNGAGNVALRLPHHIVGIDVDHYDGKTGGDTLKALEGSLGALPATWRTTSRNDGTSGIRLYRVPEGLAWPGVAGAGIEIIRHGHRYAVAPPSVHPEGGVYRWINPDGVDVIGAVPHVDELPDLPARWVEVLTGGAFATDIPRASLDDAAANAWLAGMPTGAPCHAVHAAERRWRADLATVGVSRHDTALKASARLARLAAEGHTGAGNSLAALRAAFLAAVGADRDAHTAAAEWDRMATGAARIAAASPQADDDPCVYDYSDLIGSQTGDGSPFVPTPPVIAPAAIPRLPDGFYAARPVLAHIQTAARARLVAPDALLGAVLARVSLFTDYRLHLPAMPRKGSLNVIIALCGQSGEGKGAAMDVAAELVTGHTTGCECGDLDHRPDFLVVPAGSGEGLVRNFYEEVIEQVEDSTGKKRPKPKFAVDRRHTLVRIDEGEVLASLANRQGQTTMQILRQSWSGEELGFSYANREKNLRIAAHHYRQSIVLGIQPTLAKPLFDDTAGGTPQRFIWLALSDPDVPDETPPWPGAIGDVSLIGQPWSEAIKVAEAVQREIIDTRRDKLAGRHLPSPLDSHRDLSRLKVAALLARLERRTDVSEDDWQLAGVLMDTSDAVRGWVNSLIADDAREAGRARTMARAIEAVTIEEHVVQTAVKRVSRALMRKFGDDWMPRKVLRGALPSRDRRHFDEAIAALKASGQIEAREIDHQKVSEGTEYRKVNDHG